MIGRDHCGLRMTLEMCDGPCAMALRPLSDTLKLRPEVLDPKGLLDMVDLGVLEQGRRRGLAGQGPSNDVLRDPAAFFAITYPTAEIVGTLQTLSRRSQAPESVPGTILLSGKYGIGKSHVLLAAHHALTAPNVVEAWRKRWGLKPLGLPTDPIVLTRGFIHRATEPLWEMLLNGLGKEPQKVKDFLDGRSIEALLGDRPIFLIMDELERWYDAQSDRDKSRNRNFLQALTEVSMRDGRLTLLASVLGETAEPGETIRRVRPLELSFRSAEDRQRVVLFRLFENRDSEQAQRVATEVTDTYLDAYTRAGIEDLDGLRERMISCWPFTPEFLDVLIKKVPIVGGFQSTRGTLRFLANVLRATHLRRPLVSSQDLPLKDQDVHQALSNLAGMNEMVRRALGDNYEAVPNNLPHKDELFSTLVLYSVADPTHPGVTIRELLLATLDPGENPLQIRDSLAQLKSRAFNLHEREERFVFLAFENPYARITAMASSDRVAGDAVREHIMAAVSSAWGAPERTAIFPSGDWDGLKARLRELRNQRPRIVLSLTVLSSQERLRVQNLDEQRNLVLIVEPKVRTESGSPGYSLLHDDGLDHRARRLEACKILLEGRPAEDSSKIYRRVRDDEQTRLASEVADRYGTTLTWERAGASDSQVDASWYEVHALETFSAQSFLRMVERDLTGKPEIVHAITERWTSYRHRNVAALAETFDTTPSLPIPFNITWVPEAVRELARTGVLSLIHEDGSTLSRKQLAEFSVDQLARCTIVDPQPLEVEKEEPETLLAHTRVRASYDGTTRSVVLSWTYPEDRSGAADFKTVVQRYTTVRSWTIGQHHNVDTDSTHEANRYSGGELECRDDEGLQSGQTYHYYVFLLYRGRHGIRSVLSERRDVSIPQAEEGRRVDVIETGTQAGRNQLVTEAEKLLMSGKHMRAEQRVRKIDVRLGAVSDPKLPAQVAPKLVEKLANKLELTSEFCFTMRGEFQRQEIVSLLRALPDFGNATYAASFHLRSGDTEK